ncbi:hypothetical protein MNBD_ALPHA09-847 [hydrothermal vent metagenome]|uniref:Transmembrane protein n=1 Tax=hydrothermal vent metagenome TaxID=652676 RepID=A0A3B0T5K3_9ZZZZ
MTTDKSVTPEEVIAFWFEAGPKKWFAASAVFDAAIGARFGATVDAAGAGRHDDWSQTPQGVLALVLLLDQFTRNINRGQAATWAHDARALAIAEAAIDRGFDMDLSPEQRRFLYMPFMHSEDRGAQARSVELGVRAEDEEHAKYARHHADIIERFGRFPHRNAIVGRTSTEDELAYLADDGFKG